MKLLTIQRNWQMEIVIEKSRFICTLRKFDNESEAQAFIKDLKKQYWDANHNCSAYIIGEDSSLQRSSDDGEPAGTAGVPMLEVLRKNNLHNVVAVVTRYFGGIKLGAGGLIRAYAGCVATAIVEAGLAEKVVFGYYFFFEQISEVGKILNIIYNQQLFTVADVEYSEQAKVLLCFPIEELEKVEEWLNNALNTQIVLEKEKEVYVERPLK